MPIQDSPQMLRIKRLIKQFSKFFIVGIINTGIDFAILNIEMVVTGITSGPMIILFNVISFSVAVINSYYLNKLWTFEDKRPDKEKMPMKFSQFIGVSVVGIGINSLVIFGFTALIPIMFGLSARMWVNVAKVFATGASLIWNFVGYKLWVFKK
ncbi:MAG: GtrA family protein [Candidatus Moranbacteria bacterium]|nr:GtrA family protein [Candidatus Moranbacteria bacterium]